MEENAVDWSRAPRRAEGIEVNEVADGYIVYQASRDRVHYLNHTAVLVLEMCNGRVSAGQIPGLPEAGVRPRRAAHRGGRGLPDKASGRGAGQLVLERTFQMLACEFQVVTDVEPLVRRLDEVCSSAVQEYPGSRRHRIEVRGEAGGFRVREDGGDRTLQPSPEDAGAAVLRAHPRPRLRGAGRLHQGPRGQRDLARSAISRRGRGGCGQEHLDDAPPLRGALPSRATRWSSCVRGGRLPIRGASVSGGRRSSSFPSSAPWFPDWSGPPSRPVLAGFKSWPWTRRSSASPGASARGRSTTCSSSTAVTSGGPRSPSARPPSPSGESWRNHRHRAGGRPPGSATSAPRWPVLAVTR